MAEIITWIKTNWGTICEIIGQIVILATLITGLTPTPRDEGVLMSIKKFLSIFGILNYDKSLIGSKDEWIFKLSKYGFYIGLKYISAKNKGYIPKIEFTNKLYMPISKNYIKGQFIKLTWRF